MNGGRWISLSHHEKFEISTSQSPLESWDLFSKIFFFSKLDTFADFSKLFAKILVFFSNQKTDLESTFLLSSQNSRFHISLSSRQCLAITQDYDYDNDLLGMKSLMGWIIMRILLRFWWTLIWGFGREWPNWLFESKSFHVAQYNL